MRLLRSMPVMGAALTGLLLSPTTAGTSVPADASTAQAALPVSAAFPDDPLPLPIASEGGTESESETATPSASPSEAASPLGVAPVCSLSVSTSHPITRLAGETRAGTAACASITGYPDGATTAVIARGDDAGGLADALAGTVLAHARSGPVLLTDPTRLPSETADELERLGVESVVILGGTTAVSRGVEQRIKDLGITTERRSGQTRAGTAAAIAADIGGTSAFIVNGRRPADALVAGAAAAREGAALLLVEDDTIPSDTLDALGDIDTITIVGGFGVVGEAVDNQLRTMARDVTRLGGASRYETAATVARVHPGAGTLHLVSGANKNLVDAIAGGWMGARADGGPVAYVAPDTIPQGTDRWLRLGVLKADTPTRVFGGQNAVTPAVIDLLDDRYDEAVAGGPADQVRGMWVHLFDSSLKSRAGIERVLDAATTANLNTIVVQVARRSDAFYASTVIPRTTDPQMPADMDLLEELLPAAHARGLKVHAWFSVMPSDHSVFQNEVLPADHINRTHGPESADPWMATVNLPSYDYLDPAIPGVQDHVVSMIKEVAANYAVDGIHLDYLRYAGVAGDQNPPQSEHPTTEARYAAHRLEGETKLEFMAAQTQDLARRIYVEVAEVAPQTVISAAVLAMGPGPGPGFPFTSTRTYAEKAQEWPAWVEEGILDEAFPMLYFDQSKHSAWFDSWRQFAVGIDTPEQIISPGLGSYLNTDANNVVQTEAVERELDGSVIFSYQSEGIGAGTSYFNGLSGGLHRTPAAAPTVAVKAAPTTGYLLVAAADGDMVTIVRNSTTITRRADATGHAAFVHLEPGLWELRGPDGPAGGVGITAGTVTRATL